MLIGRANIVDVLFGFGWDCFTDHRLLAVTAEQKTGKQMRLILIGRTAHIPFHHGFDSHKVFVGDQCFVGIFNLDPLSLILALHDADFVVGSSALALCQNADIDFIGEDTLDCFVCPFCDVSGFEDGIELDPRRMLVFHWRENAHLVQPVCDTANGKAVLIHGKNHLHILTHGFIHNKLILVLWGFPVTVRSERTNKLSVLLLDLQTGSDFHGNILTVGVVYQILERNNKGVRLRIAGETVVGIVDGNKSDTKLRENLLKVAATVNVVS